MMREETRISQMMKTVFPAPMVEMTDEEKNEFRQLGVVVYDDKPADKEELIRRLKDAEIVTTYGRFTADIIDALPKLKYILYPSSGYDSVDYEYAASKGIPVLNLPTFNANAVAEYAVTLLFALHRQLIPANTFLREGNWGQRAYAATEVRGKRLGLLGYGNIGKRIEALAQGLGMTTAHYNSKSTEADLQKLLRASDAVCLCLPITDATRHILNAERIAMMKPGALLINVGRGALIDQPALLTALKEGRLGGAGLDVFENEPTGLQHATPPIIELANLPNVVATSHIAFYTRESDARFSAELMANVKACLAGKPINVVNL